MQRVLITGGAGFIGSHLTERLLAEGCRVTVLDDLSTGSLENLEIARGDPRLDFIEGTILDPPLVRRLVRSNDLVIHLAAAVGVRYILDNPLSTIKTNVRGTDILLEAAADAGAKILMASTSEVYGKNDAASLCEEADSVLGPTSINRWSYATGKKLDEFLALAYARTARLPVVILRFFNIAGPRQAGRYGMVLPSFVRAALAGEPLRVFGDGRQTRFHLRRGLRGSALARALLPGGGGRGRQHRRRRRDLHLRSGLPGAARHRLPQSDRARLLRGGLPGRRLRGHAPPRAVHLQDPAPGRLVAGYAARRHDPGHRPI